MTFSLRRGQQVSNIWTMKAHDIRDVSARISLAAEELAGSDNARTRLLGSRLFSACDRIVEICEDATRKHIDRCHGDLRETITMAVDLAGYAAQPGTSIKVDVSYNVAITRDGVALFRILANLINNAVAAVNRSGGGEIHVMCFQSEGQPIITIDNPYHETNKAPDEVRGGTGLGLLIASGIAHDIGAFLDCECDGSDRVTYCLRLPRDALAGGAIPRIAVVE